MESIVMALSKILNFIDLSQIAEAQYELEMLSISLAVPIC